MVSRVVSGRLLEVAINSDEKPEVRRRAAQGIIVNEIDSIGLNQLMGAFLEDLRDGDAKILAPVLIEFPADHEFPERLQQDIIIGLKNAIAQYDELTDLRSFVDICRRYYSDQIEIVLFSSIVRESTRPLLSKKIWDTLLTDKERDELGRAYEQLLSAWIVTGVIREPSEIAQVGMGFEKQYIYSLIHNLKSDNPYIRIDAAIALNDIFGADIDYNPAASLEKRNAAIKQWQKFASDMAKGSPIIGSGQTQNTLP